jgi:hypothetical protein
MLKIDWGTMWVSSVADISRSRPNEVGALNGELVGIGGRSSTRTIDGITCPSGSPAARSSLAMAIAEFAAVARPANQPPYATASPAAQAAIP